MKYCWAAMREQELIECNKSSCCYERVGKEIFNYWKYSNSEEWQQIMNNLKGLTDFKLILEDMENV